MYITKVDVAVKILPVAHPVLFSNRTVPVASGSVITLSVVGSSTVNSVSKLSFVAPSKKILLFWPISKLELIVTWSPDKGVKVFASTLPKTRKLSLIINSVSQESLFM